MGPLCGHIAPLDTSLGFETDLWPTDVDRVVVNLETDSSFRASEIVADLRNAAETLYFPMKLVGFWDSRADIHLCPQEERREECPHRLATSDPRHIDYSRTLQTERQANLEVVFPHAGISIYLS